MHTAHLHERESVTTVVVDRRRYKRRFDSVFLPIARGSLVTLGSVTDGIMLTVKNDSVIGDNMGFPDVGLTSHSGFREQGAASR